MSSTSLDLLPDELIAHVATSCDASSAIQLSATCKTVRRAAHTVFVYKSILLISQYENWLAWWLRPDSLNFPIIAARCTTSPTLWSRYALADQKAVLLSKSAGWDVGEICSFDNLSWVPELCVVHHPICSFGGGIPAHVPPNLAASLVAKQAYTAAAVVLADEITSIIIPRSIRVEMRDQGEAMYYMEFAELQLDLKVSLRGMFPDYRDGGVPPQPYCRLPSIKDIDVTKCAPVESLPVPFSQNMDSWTSWQNTQQRALLEDSVNGEWTGYYTYNARRIGARLDGPMLNIRFRSEVRRPGTSGETHVLSAENCCDSVGSFRVDLDTAGPSDEHGLHFEGFKTYHAVGNPQRTRLRWSWSLNLTAFGLIGFWGSYQGQTSRQHGRVWLWKTTQS